jgi:hypothetical protein
MRTNPPLWNDALLSLFLKPDVFQTVSGDLLEQYRDSILPAQGLAAADQWYWRQVLALILRKIMPWAGLFAASYVAREVLDALVPTSDFHLRSEVSTGIAASLLLLTGFVTSWRSGSFFSGLIAGFALTIAAAVLSVCGLGLFLAIWHDPGTMTGFALSGGLGEAFALPVTLVLPGAFIGAFGGILGAGARRFTRIA